MSTPRYRIIAEDGAGFLTHVGIDATSAREALERFSSVYPTWVPKLIGEAPVKTISQYNTYRATDHGRFLKVEEVAPTPRFHIQNYTYARSV